MILENFPELMLQRCCWQDFVSLHLARCWPPALQPIQITSPRLMLVTGRHNAIPFAEALGSAVAPFNWMSRSSCPQPRPRFARTQPPAFVQLWLAHAVALLRRV